MWPLLSHTNPGGFMEEREGLQVSMQRTHAHPYRMAWLAWHGMA